MDTKNTRRHESRAKSKRVIKQRRAQATLRANGSHLGKFFSVRNCKCLRGRELWILLALTYFRC
jgi:hypothetical protein